MEGLAPDEPGIPFANPPRVSAQHFLTRYAQPRLVENALSDLARRFHRRVLSSAVDKSGLRHGWLVMARGLYRLLAQRFWGNADAPAR